MENEWLETLLTISILNYECSIREYQVAIVSLIFVVPVVYDEIIIYVNLV